MQKSNLQQHVKAVHLKKKPFACGFSGCGMRFSFKHVRDKHEKIGAHVYTHVSLVLGLNDIVSNLLFSRILNVMVGGWKMNSCMEIIVFLFREILKRWMSSSVQGQEVDGRGVTQLWKCW